MSRVQVPSPAPVDQPGLHGGWSRFDSEGQPISTGGTDDVARFFKEWRVAPVPEGWVRADIFVRFITVIVDVQSATVVGYYTWGFKMQLESVGPNRATVSTQPTDASNPAYQGGPYRGD
jgi:hypothetical protein